MGLHLWIELRNKYGRLIKSPGGGQGNSFQYSCLGNPMDRGTWWAAVYGVAQSRTWLKRLSMHACIGEGNDNPLQYSCLENPRDGGAWWAAVYGVTQSWTRLKWLSSSSSSDVSSMESQEALLFSSITKESFYLCSRAHALPFPQGYYQYMCSLLCI